VKVKPSRMAAAAVWVLTFALMSAACRETPPPRLLLLVSVDTLRADELGAYGSRRGLTPHLDELALESSVFTAAYASASFTLPSISTLLTGRYPEEMGIRSNESAVPESVPTLATELSARGWRAGAVVGNFVLRSSSGLARGFARFDDDFPQREAVRKWPERIASDTTDAALEMLDDCTALGEERCFLWVHYQDPHGPYDPPGSRRARYLEAERLAPGGGRQLPEGKDSKCLGTLPDYQLLHGRHDVGYYRAGYRAEINYMDEELGRLLDAMEARGLSERTVVVFAADHGESLGEEDSWFCHGSRLTDEQVRVPLIVRVPGRPAARRDEAVSLVDLYPTLLALLEGVPVAQERLGRDLFAEGAAERASRAYMATLRAAESTQYGLVDDGYKFIVSERDGVFDGRLHELGRESVDLSAAAPQIAARLRQSLWELRKRVDPGVSETRQELSEEDRESLRALGYLENDDPE
jgi:choline-sulfatase